MDWNSVKLRDDHSRDQTVWRHYQSTLKPDSETSLGLYIKTILELDKVDFLILTFEIVLFPGKFLQFLGVGKFFKYFFILCDLVLQKFLLLFQLFYFLA